MVGSNRRSTFFPHIFKRKIFTTTIHSTFSRIRCVLVSLLLTVEFMGYFFFLSKDRDFILSRYSDNPFTSTLSEQRATRYSDKPGIPTCRNIGIIFRNIGTKLSEHRYVGTMICRNNGMTPRELYSRS